MAQQTINIGTTSDDGTGDTIRNGFDKVNNNFTETYNLLTQADYVRFGFKPRSFSTSSYTAVLGETQYEYTGSVTSTLALPTAVNCTGKMFFIRNAGTGLLIIDPNSTQTLNGLLTFCLYPNHAVIIYSNGSNWLTQFNPPRQLIETKTANSSATLEIALPTALLSGQFSRYELVFSALRVATATANVNLRLSTDNGATYISSAGGYGWAFGFAASTGTGGVSSTGDSAIRITSNSANTSNLGLSGSLFVHDLLNSSRYTRTTGTLIDENNTNGVGAYSSVGQRLSNEANNGLQLFASSGNLASGTVSLFGVI